MRILPFQKGERPNFRNLDRILEFLLENRIRPFSRLDPNPLISMGYHERRAETEMKKLQTIHPKSGKNCCLIYWNIW